MTKIFKICVLSLFISLFNSVFAAGAAVDVVEQAISCGELHQQVKAKIDNLAPNARYYVYGPCVIVVSNLNDDAKARLINELKSVNGVSNVVYIASGSNSSSIGQTLDDTAVTAKIKQKMLTMDGVCFSTSHVKTLEGGVACVFVSLKNRANKDAIINELKRIAGIRHLVFCYNYE